ncbi:MAG: hypothetical protein MI754_18245, partial [Chromatiales bacterium]|nr:hypothetical protein [Chromatiales bacterium]
SNRTPGSGIGITAHEVPTVYIIDDNQYKRAIKIVGAFDPQFMRAISKSPLGGVSIVKLGIVLAVMLIASITAGMNFW